MPKLNVQNARDLLQRFEFAKLFVEELGWSHPTNPQRTYFGHKEDEFSRKQIAQLSGVVVLEITTSDGTVPDRKTLAAIHKEISKVHHENLLIFVDARRTQSLWYWVKRENSKLHPREHLYVKGQPGDLFISNLSSMVIDLSELDRHGNIPVTEVARRLKESLDVERVTKKFYEDYKTEHVRFVELIEGIDDERDRQWYASVLLNRLMFIYFLQRKFFIDKGDGEYLQRRLESANASDPYWYYGTFLKTLFFEGFAKPELKRSPEAKKLLGEIKFLNGGLFLPHKIEENPKYNIRINNQAFENILNLFKRYSWNLNDTPGEEDNEIRPDVLGYIFEKYINQKAFGAYYTRTEITEYLCEQTINKLILEKVNDLLSGDGPGAKPVKYETIADLLLNLDAFLCKILLTNILPSLSILDPACGSGAFLVAALKTLIKTYSAVIGRIEFLNDRNLNKWLNNARREHPSVSYFIKKRIITDNLFGVDIMEEASEIAKLRLFLTLVASAETVEQLEPLPNIDFNLLTGNSLIGLMHVDDKEFDQRHAQGNLFRKSYGELLAETKRKIDNYRKSAAYSEHLVNLRDEIDELKRETALTLDEILLSEFQKLGIKFEQVTWDEKKKKEGKPTKRPLKLTDIRALKPFHWGFDFDDIINSRHGFDVIIANAPWEIFKPNAKEFFTEHSALVKKKKMDIKKFEKEQSKLLADPEIREAWLQYLSSFPHLSGYFRSATQYINQISIVDGKKAGTDINLYKLFLEQSFNLLRPGGRCGIILQSGTYTDLGTKQLREMLFSQCEISSLFGLSNEKFIFENVHHAQKFCILVFEKGGQTEAFEAAFRINPREALSPERIGSFLNSTDEHLAMSVPLIRRLSPNSLSIMEFKSETDGQIAEKMLKFPLLGEKISGTWNFQLTAEFHMTNDSHLFKTKPSNNRLELYEGKMIHQFNDRFSEPRYWVDEKEGRRALLGKERDTGQRLEYQDYRLGLRAIASNTNTNSMICSALPKNVFCGNSILSSQDTFGDYRNLMFCIALLDSFVVDWMLRNKVSQNINMFFVYQLPIPRLTTKDPAFGPIVARASKLICTKPEFDDLARAVDSTSHRDGATEPTERARLRAQLEGMIAQLYGLTEEEFAYILTTFPLVPEPAKVAAQNAFRDVDRGLIR